MKKIIFVAALTMMISLVSCGKVESREANNSLIRNQRIITEEINQDISFKNDESHLELEDNSSRVEKDSLEMEDNSSKMNNDSSRTVIVLKEDGSSFREEEKEENNVSYSNASITILDSCSSSNPVLGEKVKPEMGPPPVDKEPTLGEDKIQIVGCPTPQITEVIVFKPSTHYLHRSTCHWVDDECYEISDTSNIEARICTECNPDIIIQNEYVEPIPTYSIDAYSRQLLAEIVWHEYGSDWVSIPEKARIAAGVMNRVNDSRFPNTVYEVLVAPGQFTGYWPGCCSPTQSCYDAVDYYFSHQNEFGCENSWWGDSYQNHFYYQ